jgi:hypothetical protein
VNIVPISQPQNYKDFGYDDFVERRVKEEIPAEKLDVNPDNYVTFDSLDDLNFDGIPDLSIPGPALGSKYIEDETLPGGATNTGWLYPSAFTTGAGEQAWTNGANGYSADGVFASIAASQYGPAARIFYKTFGATIPGGATVVGMEMQCDCYRTNPLYLPQTATTFYHAQILSVLGNDQMLYLNKDWPTSLNTVVVGSGGTWWSVQMTPGYMNNANWGIGVTVYADYSVITYYVDCVRVKIYYTV